LVYFDDIPLPAQKKTKTVSREFFAPKPGAYTLRVVKPATGVVGNLEVRLNGALVTGPNQGNSRVTLIPVAIQSENTISAKLVDAERGSDGRAGLLLLIEPSDVN